MSGFVKHASSLAEIASCATSVDAKAAVRDKGEHQIKTSGFVKHVSSLADIASCATSVDVKGAVWDRGAHAHAAAMISWLAENRGSKKFYNAVRGMSYAEESFVINGERMTSASTAGSDGANTSSTDSNSDVSASDSDSDSISTQESDPAVIMGHGHSHGATCCHDKKACESFNVSCAMNTVDLQLEGASTRLVSSLPECFRKAICQDAMDIGRMMASICTTSNKKSVLSLKLEIVGKNRCSRWHQDNYIGRTVVTYVGSGTWLADDVNVRFSQFAATKGLPFHESDPRIVPQFEKVHRTKSNAVVLMKGNRWPGICGYPKRKGLTHKAPNVETDAKGKPRQLRLLLKVDVEEQ